MPLFSLLNAELCSSRTSSLKSYSYANFFKLLCSGFFRKSNGDEYYKGRVRTFFDARALGVIDRRVAPLVEIMNSTDLMLTIASCQGHGFPFIRVPPYISFKTSTDIASVLDCNIDQFCGGNSEKLRHRWAITRSLNDDATLTYVLHIPDLSAGKLKFVTRRQVDQDFKLLGSIKKKILNHFCGEEIKMKCQENQCENN